VWIVYLLTSGQVPEPEMRLGTAGFFRQQTSSGWPHKVFGPLALKALREAMITAMLADHITAPR
jgi:hypothetical protein